MIIVFGSLNMDIVFRALVAPRAKETLVTAEPYAFLPGGKGANQAVAASRMGSKVFMTGCVGSDDFGRTLLAILEEEKVDTKLVATTDRLPTGAANIVVDGTGENRILVSSSANREARSNLIPDKFLAPDNIVLMQMETDPAQVSNLAARAKAKGSRVILNLAPAIFPGEGTLRNIDFLIMNEPEIEQLAQDLSLKIKKDFKNAAEEYAAIAEVAASIATDFNLTCVVTRGSKGAAAFQPKGQILTSPAYPITKAVDTTGAGDAFCGAFAAAMDQGRTLQRALDLGCVMGSLSCLKKGAMVSYPSRDDVMKALEANTPRPL